MIDVSIIIVTYNTLQLTKDCIDSIFQHTQGLRYEIILVDNASTDGSKEYFNNLDDIKYIYSTENLGFGRANNLGYKYSKGQYIFLLNSDTLLSNNAIKMFYDYMESASPNVACCGGWLQDAEQNYIHSFGAFPTLWRSFYYWNLMSIMTMLHLDNNEEDWAQEQKKSQNVRKVDYITGADLFIRREVIEKKGLFDEDFFLYYEETEMQYRYSTSGYSMNILKGPEIKHLVGGSDKDTHLKKKSIFLRSLFLYIDKCYNKATSIWYKPLFKYTHVILTSLSPVKWSEKKKYLSEILSLR